MIVAAARSLIGTPYQAYGRVPGVGIDCAGLPIVVGRMVGRLPPDFDVNGYSLHPDGSLIPLCRKYMTQVRREDMADGDVLIVKWGNGEAQHFGILATHEDPAYKGARTLIHADQKLGRVVEHRLHFNAHTRFAAAFRF